MSDAPKAPPPDEPFLARWSRRKRQGTPSETAPPAAATAAAAGSDLDGPSAEPSTEAAFDPATLPRIEDLTADSDLTVFLRRGVPDLLRQQALRRMWTLDPAIRDFVEMAENQYDWNLPGGVPGFGELNPGTDLAGLLDQALGKWPAPVSPDAVADPQADPAVANAPLGTAEAHAPAQAAADMREEAAPPTSLALPAGTPEAATAEPPSRAVARHGGALPL